MEDQVVDHQISAIQTGAEFGPGVSGIAGDVDLAVGCSQEEPLRGQRVYGKRSDVAPVRSTHLETLGSTQDRKSSRNGDQKTKNCTIHTKKERRPRRPPLLALGPTESAATSC